MAVRLVDRIAQELKLEVGLRTLFAHPTLAEFAAAAARPTALDLA